MAAKTLAAPFPVLRTLARGSACICPRPAPHRPPPPRSFSTAPPARQQASWDSLDHVHAFQPATSLREPKTRPPSRHRNPSSSSSRSPRVPRTPRKPSSANVPEPPLPPLSRSTPLSALDPVHLHAFRLALLQQLHRPPSDADLERFFYEWLNRAYNTRARALEAEIAKQKRDEDKRVRLDLAWEWERQAAEQAGVPRTDTERKKDAIVLERIAHRKRAERAERELNRDVRTVEALDRARGKSTAGVVEGREGAAASAVPEWKKHRQAMRDKFPTGWAPPKRLSREAMDLIRSLARSDPVTYSLPRLAERFKISPEAVRRVLKSRFELAPDERARREIRRKEARQKEIVEGGAPTWGGNLAAEQRELQALRSSKKIRQEP
ncbi:hypothetical protein JCM3770_005406 [Rhodotorula araucariae]